MSDTVVKSKRAKQASKSSKPLLERQRRARINNSLNELKNLVLSSLYNGCPQAEKSNEKMEKAEILELTVNFLKLVRNRRLHQVGFRPADSKEAVKSKCLSTNYNECFNGPLEVSQRWNEHLVVPHSAPLTPYSMSGTSPSTNEGICIRSVRPYVGYKVTANTSKLSPTSLSKNMVESTQHQPCSSPHVPRKIQVWRPW